MTKTALYLKRPNDGHYELEYNEIQELLVAVFGFHVGDAEQHKKGLRYRVWSTLWPKVGSLVDPSILLRAEDGRGYTRPWEHILLDLIHHALSRPPSDYFWQMKAVLGEDLACELYMAIVRSGIDVLDSSKRRYDELAAAIGFGYGAAHADVLTRAKCLNEAYARSGADHRGDQPTSLDELERRIMSTITHAIVNEDGVLEGKTGPVPDGALKATPIERKPGCFRLEGNGAIIPMVRFQRVGDLDLTGGHQ
jgi:hypothetical protein